MNLIFIKPGAKINKQYNGDVLLTECWCRNCCQQICSVAGCARSIPAQQWAHYTQCTVELWSLILICGQATVLTCM